MKTKTWHISVSQLKLPNLELSGPVTLKLTVSQKWADEINWFFHADTNSGKLEFDSMVFGWVGSKMAMAFHEPLKSAVSWEWIYKLSWFDECWQYAIIFGETDIWGSTAVVLIFSFWYLL